MNPLTEAEQDAIAAAIPKDDQTLDALFATVEEIIATRDMEADVDQSGRPPRELVIWAKRHARANHGHGVIPGLCETCGATPNPRAGVSDE